MTERRKQPLVSILLPTYNRERYVRQAIESILHQTYENFELIIVDDGSTDNTPKIIKEYAQKDGRVRIYTNKKNMGTVFSYNRALKMAKGKYIAIMNDDDYIIDKEKIKKQVNFLEKNEQYVLVGGLFYNLDSVTHSLEKVKSPIKDDEIRKRFHRATPICHANIIFKRSTIEESNKRYESYVPGSYAVGEDLEMMMFLGTKGKMHNLKEYLLVRRAFGGSGLGAINTVHSIGQRNYSKRGFVNRLRIMLKYTKQYKFQNRDFIRLTLLFIIGYLYTFLPRKSREPFRPLGKLLEI